MKLDIDKSAGYIYERLSAPDSDIYASGTPSGRLADIVYARRREAGDLLKLVRTDVTEKKQSMPSRIAIYASPVLSALAVLALLSEKYAASGIAAALALCASVYVLLSSARSGKAESRAYLNSEELDLYTVHAAAEANADITEISAAYFSGEAVSRSQNENETAEIYSALYEMRTDKPDDPDISWAFSVASSLLRKAGLCEKEYSEENAMMYQVMPYAGRPVTRKTAIVRADDGLLVKKGLRLGK